MEAKIKVFTFILSHLFLQRCCFHPGWWGREEAETSRVVANRDSPFPRGSLPVGVPVRCEERGVGDDGLNVLRGHLALSSGGAHRNGQFPFPEAPG